jgi:predicted  nucleic acid-binding Zn-ribbon protein
VQQLRAELDTEVERLVERVRTTEIAYLDHQAAIDALRLDLVAMECRMARLEVTLPAGKYEARKGIPEG